MRQVLVIFYFIVAIVFEIINADISTPIYAKALVDLLSIYTLDRMGGGTELSSYVKENLAQLLGATQIKGLTCDFIGLGL